VAVGLGVLAVTLGIACGGTTPAQDQASIYPRPVSFPDWGPPSGCPSLEGVARAGRHAPSAALAVLSRFGAVSKEEDLRLSDRALWPVVRESWSGGYRPNPPRRLRPRDVVAGAASESPYVGLVENDCGRATVRHSVWVAVCGRGRKHPCSLSSEPALTTHYLLLDRLGRWLVWWLSP